MVQLTPAVLDFVAQRHGIASRAELRHLGLSEHAITTLRRDGVLAPMLHGVYRIPAVPLDERVRCRALCAGHPEAVITGPTAGRLWGFRRMPPDQRVHALFPPHSQPTVERWVVPYRTAAFHPDTDVVCREDGIRIASRARAALDLARFLRPTDLLSVIEQAMHDGRLMEDELRRTALDWLSPQRPWVRTYLQLIDRRVPGGAAESHPEVGLGDALRDSGVRGLVRQFDIDLPDYGPARFDLAVPPLRWAIEVDAFPTHRETNGRRSDRTRDRAATSVDWLVTRVGPDGLGTALPATVLHLVDVWKARRAQSPQR